MVREAAWSHSKGGDLLWRKLQLSCLLGAEVRYFLDHFLVLIRGRCYDAGEGGAAGEEAFWPSIFVLWQSASAGDALRHLHHEKVTCLSYACVLLG